MHSCLQPHTCHASLAKTWQLREPGGPAPDWSALLGSHSSGGPRRRPDRSKCRASALPRSPSDLRSAKTQGEPCEALRSQHQSAHRVPCPVTHCSCSSTALAFRWLWGTGTRNTIIYVNHSYLRIRSCGWSVLGMRHRSVVSRDRQHRERHGSDPTERNV